MDAAAAALGVRAVLHLVDYAQAQLVPVTVDIARAGVLMDGEPLGVDSTMAGQAFQRVRLVASANEDRPRLWVPVLDAVDRVGVLEVVADDDRDLADPRLRRDCQWVANLVGHLVGAVSATGDALDAVRRSQPRTPSAELVCAGVSSTFTGMPGRPPTWMRNRPRLGGSASRPPSGPARVGRTSPTIMSCSAQQNGTTEDS